MHVGRTEKPESVKAAVRAGDARQHVSGGRAGHGEDAEVGGNVIDDIPVVTFAIATMSSAVGIWFRENGRLTADAVASIYGDIALRAAGQPQPVSLAPAGSPSLSPAGGRASLPRPG
jgi:hypothetical protein